MKNRSFGLNQQFHMPWRLLGILFLVVVFVMLASSSCTQIPATHIGVGENQFTGEYFTLEPGLHVWPLDPRIVPFAVNVTKYDLRRQIIEIGGEPAEFLVQLRREGPQLQHVAEDGDHADADGKAFDRHGNLLP